MTQPATELQLEIEVMGILDEFLCVPAEERASWLEAQALKAKTEARVRTLIDAASITGEFLEVPPRLRFR